MDQPLQAPLPQGQVKVALPPNEREAMYNAFVHFVDRDNQKREEFLRLFQSEQPALIEKFWGPEQIQAQDLSDEVVRGISQIIYERDTAKDVDIEVPQQQVTREMQEFNDAYVGKLLPARLYQLQDLIKASVPSTQMREGEWLKTLPPSRLPENEQIFLNKFLKAHLPDEVKGAIEQGESVPDEQSQGIEDLNMEYQAYIDGGWMFDGNLEPVEPEEESEEESEEE
ncbi:hypothetical protein EDD37DRAFT_59224 [Exophiala viscosa]|uniref:Uncharacterized protein n=1 Tax=Exophiala viscosa TaxID=2486360 RepID=A0AAN6E493_9EURO|nr:hypothetical protein EDD36DRAFT_461741 [Exophiala viscosa]KAI1629566.1 hypothetical protein EDD37DRAFT_59224 [Exophiala viscosa]